MNKQLLSCALVGLTTFVSCYAGDLNLRKLSEAETKSSIPRISAEYGFARLGFYEFRNNITLLQFVAFSGGILPDAGGDSVKVLRDGKALSIHIGRVLDGSSEDILLRAGDRVIAPNQGCFGGGLTTEELVEVNRRITIFTEKIKNER